MSSLSREARRRGEGGEERREEVNTARSSFASIIVSYRLDISYPGSSCFPITISLLSGIGHILRFVRFSFVAFVFSRVRLYISY